MLYICVYVFVYMYVFVPFYHEEFYCQKMSKTYCREQLSCLEVLFTFCPVFHPSISDVFLLQR